MFGPIKKPTRLGQWDGRRRSSRSDEPVLPRLWQRSVLLRLGAVLVTALSASFLAYYWGPSQSYRVGEICTHDLRARVYFEVVNQAQTDRRRDEAVDRLPPDRRSDPAACEAARQAEPAVVERYPIDTLLVKRGQPVTEAQFNLLEEETRFFFRGFDPWDQLARAAALFLVLSLLSVVVVLYVIRFQQSLANSLS